MAHLLVSSILTKNELFCHFKSSSKFLKYQKDDIDISIDNRYEIVTRIIDWFRIPSIIFLMRINYLRVIKSHDLDSVELIIQSFMTLANNFRIILFY